jgi:hypothetical protein
VLNPRLRPDIERAFSTFLQEIDPKMRPSSNAGLEIAGSDIAPAQKQNPRDPRGGWLFYGANYLLVVEQLLETMLTFFTLNVPCEEEPLLTPPEAEALELPAPAPPEMLPLVLPAPLLPLMPLFPAELLASDPLMRT